METNKEKELKQQILETATLLNKVFRGEINICQEEYDLEDKLMTLIHEHNAMRGLPHLWDDIVEESTWAMFEVSEDQYVKIFFGSEPHDCNE